MILELDIWENVTKFKDNNGFWVKQSFIENEIIKYEDSDGNYWTPEITKEFPFYLYKLDYKFLLMYRNDENFMTILMGNFYVIYANTIYLTHDITFNNINLFNMVIHTNNYNIILGNNIIFDNMIIYGGHDGGGGISLRGDNVTISNCTIFGYQL